MDEGEKEIIGMLKERRRTLKGRVSEGKKERTGMLKE